MSKPNHEADPSPESASSPGRRGAHLHKLLRVIAYSAVAILLLLAFLPTGLRLGAEHWLNKQPGIDAEIGNIDLNLFSATFALEDLSIEYQGIPHTQVKRLAVAVKYLPLWDKHALIDYVELQGVRLVLKQLEPEAPGRSGALRIGGLLFPHSGSAPPKSEAKDDTDVRTSPWGFGWNRVEINDAEVVWRQPEWSADLLIEHAQLNDVASWKPNTDSALHLQLRLNDAPVNVTAQTRPFAPRRSARGNLKIDAFALGKLKPILAPAGVHDLRGIFSCDLEHEVSLSAAGDVSLGWGGTIALTQGKLSTAQIHIADAGFHWEGEGDITTSPDSVTQISLDSTLQIPVLYAEALESGMALQQEGLRWSGKSLTTLKQGDAADVEIQGGFATAILNVVDKARARQLASWEGLEGSGVTFAENQLQLDQLSVEELIALRPSTNPTETEPPLARCGTINLKELRVDLEQEDGGTAIALKNLTLGDMGVEVIRFASGHTNIEQWRNPAADTTERADNPRASEDVEASVSGGREGDTPSPPLRWRLDRLQIEGNSYVHYTDAATNPAVSLDMNTLNLRLEDLDSSVPQTRNPLSLDATLGRFATLKADGALSVLAPEPQGDLELKLHGFQLYSIAPYVKEAIGARVERGELDVNANASLEDNILELESQADLRSFTLGDVSPEQEEQISNNLGMPLSLALALLRDNDGDIHLNIPVSGDLSSPDIAIASIVRKALFGAVQETVKLALKPLGIISGAGKLLGIGRELQLPPAVFSPGEDTLTDPVTVLKPLRELLAQRPQLGVILSAPLTEADAVALRQSSGDAESAEGKSLANTASESDNTEEAETPPMSEEDFRAAANALLQERLHTVKGWLLDNDKVHNNQIILTHPRIAPVPGEPRVEMRF